MLAANGVYALMTYTLQQRRSEFAVRMPLGASRQTLWAHVICDPMRLAVAGVVIGLVLALGVAHLLAGLLFGVPKNAVAFAVAPVVLTLVARSSFT